MKNLTNITTCASCANFSIPKVILNDSGVAVCDPSLVDSPEYTEYNAGWYDVEDPYYLDSLTDDCSVFGFEPNITQDLSLRLLVLNGIEAQVNDTESHAHQLYDQGSESLGSIAVAAYQQDPNNMFSAPMEPSYPSVNSRYHDVEMSYPTAGMGRVAVQEIKNFHHAYEYALNAKNDTRALEMTLQSLVQGLENNSLEGKCMFQGQKDYYERLLWVRYTDTLSYVNETRRIIDHARDFASEYVGYKEHLDRSECFGLMIGGYELPSEMANVSPVQDNGTFPAMVAKRFPNTSYVISINHSKNESYIVEAKLPKKLLGLISVEMPVTSEIDADTGEVIKEEKPWWSFLMYD